ncbi:diaminopropionate ammonia-lyase [Azospirillum sp. TSH7]|uniref:diaminopropionate ammonia-lyase n=1 Tax=unclassified Azospirillum TaxID=2630922 RepID=UPI000D60388F|nr:MULTISPECIES: diaminopropionate ammonia-lyase [unclassified Azospirillum]PWC58093.1 diaminopropionate ammonia-lyase [Azospirillum sp. TSH20]PWC61491.1 diaminopropionate ammonia-lyase [Azospirillum sp. TSH7]
MPQHAVSPSSCLPRHFSNPHADHDRVYGPSERAILSRAAFEEAMAEIGAWPGYAPTPLRSLPGLAREAGIDRLWYKDESARFALGSFKALGGAYAVLRLLAREVTARVPGVPVTALDLVVGRYAKVTRTLTVTTATDGNHGRSVAWGAQVFGCNCVVYVPAACTPGRRDAIRAYGARVVVVDGPYDDAVRRAAADAAEQGWFVVSDTSYSGYMDVPRDVMQGYTMMVEEAISQLPASERPTHVFVQGGVGGLPAAVCGHLWESWGRQRPRFVVVEPHSADCLYQSALAGRPMRSEGDLDTVMAGLACGEVSLLAWAILERGADDFLTIPDEGAIAAMRKLAEGKHGGRPVVAGESGVAGLAGLLCAAAHEETRLALGLVPDARVLVFGTEGATDPEVYERIVGRTPEAVAEGLVSAAGR